MDPLIGRATRSPRARSVTGMAGVEEVGVDVERDRDARVTEDAADLSDVDAEVDDQVAGGDRGSEAAPTRSRSARLCRRPS